jgi:hypothetical protein
MSFTMAPVFPSTDLDRTAEFWGRLGFVEAARYSEFGSLIVTHPMGLVLHFGLDRDVRPAENRANAYLRFSTAAEAVALYEDWAHLVPRDGEIHSPAETFYGLIEWQLLDPDRNLLRVGGSPEEPPN